MVKYIPSSLDDALEFLATHDAYIVAGGSDMMVLKRNAAGIVFCYINTVPFLYLFYKIYILFTNLLTLMHS